jgi:diadenylate cyclase
MNILMYNISTVISAIDRRTIFDVLIIAVLIFYLYRTLRSSGTLRILLGIFIALLIFTVARIFRLEGITWLFSNFSDIALLALIVIFQPEIRKIFEKAASTFRLRELTRQGILLSSVITDAAFDLAGKRWGAIIVLPGRVSIDAKISGGTKIDAMPSCPLITSLFDPHSPGHDGAMIIDNGKISRFGMRLPLSSSDRLGSSFGMRHHAALGLSENSDSMIIAVSEERGTVMLFQEGEHTLIDSKSSLASLIDSFYGKFNTLPVPGSMKSRGITLLEFWMSILIAFLLWGSIVIGTSQMKEMNVTVPLEYLLANSDMVIMGEKPTAARIRIAGTSTDLNQVKPEGLRAVVDLTKAVPGKQSITLTKNNMRLPQGVNLVDANPSSFEITVQSLVEKEVSIKPQVIGRLPDGLQVASIEVNPPRIKILYSSEASENDEIFIMTTPIYLQNITENTKLLCNLIAPPDIYPIEKQLPDVVVSITLRPAR